MLRLPASDAFRSSALTISLHECMNQECSSQLTCIRQNEGECRTGWWMSVHEWSIRGTACQTLRMVAEGVTRGRQANELAQATQEGLIP